MFSKMIGFGGLVLGAALFVPGAAAVAAPIVADYSFEATQIGSGNYIYSPNGQAWTYSASAGFAGVNSPFFLGNPPDGTQAAFIQNAGSISQTISGFVSGQQYVVTFYAAQRDDAVGNIRPPNNITVSLGGQNLGTSTAPSTSFGLVTSGVFTATGSTALLSFTGVSAYDIDTVIDDVAITQQVRNDVADVPEPASMALLGAGLAAVGVLRRRRK